MIPHPGHHRADVNVAAGEVSGRDRTSGALEVAAVRQLAAMSGRDGLDSAPIDGVEVKVEVRPAAA
jgi:hypothetical protein